MRPFPTIDDHVGQFLDTLLKRQAASFISAPNRVHPLSNADLHDAADEGAPVNLLSAVRMKWTIDADGNWIERPAAEIDGDHPLTQFERETDNV